MSSRNDIALEEIGYELYIPMPEFLSEQWVLEQCSRIKLVAQRVLALHDAGSRGDFQVFWNKQRGGCIVVFQTRNADILQFVSNALNEHGFRIEDARSETIQARR